MPAQFGSLERARKALPVFSILLTLGFGVSSMAAVEISNFTPEKGKTGHTGVVHGSGFAGNGASIKFGSKSADDVRVTSDQVVKFNVPVTDASDRLPTDPSKVAVTVQIVGTGGEILTAKDFIFQYDASGIEATITGFDPPEPDPGPVIGVLVEGSNFTNVQGRRPTSVYLLDEFNIGVAGAISDVSADGTSFVTQFVSLPPELPFHAGTYTVIVGFSDGAWASGVLNVFP